MYFCTDLSPPSNGDPNYPCHPFKNCPRDGSSVKDDLSLVHDPSHSNSVQTTLETVPSQDAVIPGLGLNNSSTKRTTNPLQGPFVVNTGRPVSRVTLVAGGHLKRKGRGSQSPGVRRRWTEEVSLRAPEGPLQESRVRVGPSVSLRCEST